MIDDPTIRWTLANPFGIQINAAVDAWYSGHTTDVLELPAGRLLTSTQTGGVWSISGDAATTMPLSDSWSNPDVNCLAAGIDDPNAHFFAGCTQETLRETDLGDALPLFAWVPVNKPLPAGSGDVHRIVIIRNLRRIVVACDGGLYWATIPATPEKPGCLNVFGPKPKPRELYVWHQAQCPDIPEQGFWDVAIGATGGRQDRSGLEDRRVITVVAGGFYSGGLFVGQWDKDDNLVLRQAHVAFDDGSDATLPLFNDCGTSSVSSCEVRPTVFYAAVAWQDGRLNSLLRSEDGGRNWHFCPAQNYQPTGPLDIVPAVAGDQGADWNNCISAAPTNSAMAALGWQKAAFLTIDAGKTWRRISDSPHLHDDVHLLRFTPDTPSDVHNLYICSDGGLSRVDLDAFGLGKQAYQSNYNRLLPTLQCLPTYHPGEFYGTLFASSQQPGLIASGLQDNGNAYCLVDPVATPWIKLDGGDGGINFFLIDGGLLHNISGGEEEKPVRAAITMGPGSIVDKGVVPVGLPVTDPNGITRFAGDAVRRPSHRNDNYQLLLAVGGTGNLVYGCYPNDDPQTPYHWESIATLPAGVEITAAGSYSGGTIHVGASGRMFAVDTKQGTALELPVVLPSPSAKARVKPGEVDRIVCFSETDFFATMNAATATTTNPLTGATTTVMTSYYVLHQSGLQWLVTPGAFLPQTGLYGLEAVAEPNTRAPHALVVTTDDRVYISRDDGATWQRASAGLPRNPHCRDVRVCSTHGGAWLYLSTYGRSVYVVRLRG